VFSSIISGSYDRMELFPALALLELESVAVGIRVTDAMVKRAPIAQLKFGTVHPGHFLVLVGGSVASVEEAFDAGLAAGGPRIRDCIFLPDVHPSVYRSAHGERNECRNDTVGILETTSVAGLLGAADAAVKGTDVSIVELRMADDLGGKAFVIFTGELAEIQSALEIGGARIPSGRLHGKTIVPRLDDSVRSMVTSGTIFNSCTPYRPEGAELHETR